MLLKQGKGKDHGKREKLGQNSEWVIKVKYWIVPWCGNFISVKTRLDEGLRKRICSVRNPHGKKIISWPYISRDRRPNDCPPAKCKTKACGVKIINYVENPQFKKIAFPMQRHLLIWKLWTTLLIFETETNRTPRMRKSYNHSWTGAPPLDLAISNVAFAL